MDKELRKLLDDVQASWALRSQELLSEKDVFKQVRAMRTPSGINARKLIDYIERDLIPAPVRGGYGVQRMFSKHTATEYDASVRLGARLSLADVREARRLALTLENCRDFRDVLAHRNDFRDKEHCAPAVIFWLRVKIANLKFLYDDYPHDRAEYFNSNAFALVVFGLTQGFYEGYAVDADGNLVRPRGKAVPDPEQSIKSFVGGTELTTTMSVAAKPRE